MTGRPYCHEHFHARFGFVCADCGRPIVDEEPLVVLGRKYHNGCLKCTLCRADMGDGAQIKVHRAEG